MTSVQCRVCNRKPVAKGLCSNHYVRWQTYRRLNVVQPRWTDDEKIELRTLFSIGKSIHEIIAKTGKSKSQIKGQIDRMGLSWSNRNAL